MNWDYSALNYQYEITEMTKSIPNKTASPLQALLL